MKKDTINALGGYAALFMMWFAGFQLGELVAENKHLVTMNNIQAALMEMQTVMLKKHINKEEPEEEETTEE